MPKHEAFHFSNGTPRAQRNKGQDELPPLAGQIVAMGVDDRLSGFEKTG